MIPTPLARAVAFATASTCLTLPTLAQAEFIKDSKASLELRNFYMNRDFRQDGDPAQPKVTGKTPAENRSKSEEWAQGFPAALRIRLTPKAPSASAWMPSALSASSSTPAAATSGTGLLQRRPGNGRSPGQLRRPRRATAKVQVCPTDRAQGWHPDAQAAGADVQRFAPAAAKLPGGLDELPGNHRA